MLVVGIEFQEIVRIGPIESKGESEGKLESDSVEIEVVFVGNGFGVMVLFGGVGESIDDILVPLAEVCLYFLQFAFDRFQSPFVLIDSCPG